MIFIALVYLRYEGGVHRTESFNQSNFNEVNILDNFEEKDTFRSFQIYYTPLTNLTENLFDRMRVSMFYLTDDLVGIF